MAIAVTITNIDNTQDQIIVDGTLALSGNYGVGSGHGDVMSLQLDQIKSGALPTQVVILEQPAAGTAWTGYSFIYCPGTTQALGKVQIWNAGGEYTQGSAYSTTFPNAIHFTAFFPSL